jgi:hypothetical protein
MDFKTWFENSNSGLGYHVTSKENLPGIAAKGLIPNYRKNWKDHFGLNSKLGVFFTISPQEIKFWMGKYENPVLLNFRFDIDELIGVDTHAPESNANFIIPRKIPANDIELWTGQNWQPITASQDVRSPYKVGRQKKSPYPRTTGNLGTKRLYSYQGKWWEKPELPPGIQL